MGMTSSYSVEIGAFTRIWHGEPIDIATRMSATGIECAQWNFKTIGRPTLWADADTATISQVRAAFETAGVRLWGLSCTYNIIDPDVDRRERTTQDALRLIGHAPALGVSVVTICTGSADGDNMWAAHPDNDTEWAWNDAVTTIRRLLDRADTAGVLIAVEPEAANVVSDAVLADLLRSEVGFDAPLGFVIDPANLLTPDTIDQQSAIIPSAFELLESDVVAVHAKDLDGTRAVAPGLGTVDFETVADAHLRHAPGVPIIIQDTEESDMVRTVDFLRETWMNAGVRR